MQLDSHAGLLLAAFLSCVFMRTDTAIRKWLCVLSLRPAGTFGFRHFVRKGDGESSNCPGGLTNLQDGRV